MRIIFNGFGLILTAIILFTSACKAQTSSQISGKITLDPEWKPMVYLVQPRNFKEIAGDYLGEIIDSAAISPEGDFSFSPLPIAHEKVLLQLVVQRKTSRFPNHLTDKTPAEANYMPVVLEKGSQIALHADASIFQKSFAIINPTKENVCLSSLREIRRVAFENYMAASTEEHQADSLLMEQEDAYLSYIGSMMVFADTTSCIEAAMTAIRWISPTGDYERIPEFINGQCQKWQRDQPEHPYTQQLCDAVDKLKLPALVGDVMPDFPLPLVTGDTVMLHSMLGQRLTIVDIWASWCAPCRRENRTVLVPLWSAYKDQGVQIIGYSIDSNPSSWEAAITKDGALWVQASHVSGDVSPFLEALRITTIPANYILDNNGKILAKNLHGEALTGFIQSRME